jgi:spore photoproduct lyase
VTTLPVFSHLYIEDAARSLPLTEQIRARFPKAVEVSIVNYKEVFNRPRQRWDHQQQSLKLIIAKRRDAFLYQGSSFVPNFAHDRFYYTTPILNCLYGCEYCYLQGMFPSANMVVFANDQDFITAAENTLTPDTPAYLCISYDTDLLAVEQLFGYCATWIAYAKDNAHVTVEIRTKSANIQALKHITPSPNIILAWTLSPETITHTYEHKTPSLQARLEAISVAQQQGWKVRLCFDPILRLPDWQANYRALIQQTFQTVCAEKLADISLGVFRIASGYRKALQERSPQSKLATYPYKVENSAASYTKEQTEEMLDYVSNELIHFVPQEKICPVPWQL